MADRWSPARADGTMAIGDARVMSRVRCAGVLTGLFGAVVVLAFSLGLAAPPAPCGPARSGCIACHTDRALLEPLVQPFPELPAEGEG